MRVPPSARVAHRRTAVLGVAVLLLPVLAVTASAQTGSAAPVAPAEQCDDTSPQVVDPEGDATVLIVETGTQSEPSLDLREGRLTWDDGAKELSIRIRVTDLSAGTGDQILRIPFTREDDRELTAVAARNGLGEQFLLEGVVEVSVTGSFDEATDVVTIVVSAAKYAEVAPDEEAIAAGDTIRVGGVEAQRFIGALAVTADTAAGSCPFTVPASGSGESGDPSDPEPSGEPKADEAPEPSESESPQPSESEEPSESPSPESSESPSSEPSESSQPSESPEPSPSSSGGLGEARTLDSACPEDRVPASSQTDDDGNVHERAIECMLWWEIAQGTSSSDYDPEVEVSREQMASFVARLIEKGGAELPAGDNAFTDDDTSHHHANINRLAAAGLVDGKADGGFGPTDTVSRAQMAKFIVNAYEFVSDQTLTSSKDYFDDDTGNALEEFIDESAEAGFTTGRNGRYEPGLPVLRDQMASFLARTLDLLVAEGTTPAKQ